MRKFISIILAILIFIMSFSSIVMADSVSVAEKSAAALNSINLFKGTDLGYELGREPSRMECVVTIIRLLGEEKTALECTDENPFTDVEKWADRYAAYAYKRGITNGVSATEFGYNVKADCQQFAALLLRALSYTGEYEKALGDGIKLGIIDKNINSDKFLRGDMVIMSYLALSVKDKDLAKPLSDKLIEKGVFTAEQYIKAKAIMGNSSNDDSVSGSSSSGNSSGGSSSNGGLANGNISEKRAELNQLMETVKDYYSELEKVIVLVSENEEIMSQFEIATEKFGGLINTNINKISDKQVEELMVSLNELYEEMEMIAIQVAIER